jgi:hypothetical protein
MRLLFFFRVTIYFSFSKPPTSINSIKKSCLSTAVLLYLAAINAASLQTLAISAPEKPGLFAKSLNQGLLLFSKAQGAL